MGCACGAAGPAANGLSGLKGSASIRFGYGADVKLNSVVLGGGEPPFVTGLASPSLVYCHLVAHGDAAVVIDVRQLSEARLRGAWRLESGARSEALWSRCGLRTVVLCGAQAEPLREAAVLEALRGLRSSGARQKGPPLLLRGGLPALQRRFPFCFGAGALPEAPSELLEPARMRMRPPALYASCSGALLQPEALCVVRALGIRTVLQLGGAPAAKGLRAITVENPSTACEQLRKQTGPVLLIGAAAALGLAMALLLLELGQASSSVEEITAYVRLRFPAATFDTSATATLSEQAARMLGQPAASGLRPASEPGPPPPAPVAQLGSQPSHVEVLCARLKARGKGASVAVDTVRRAMKHVLEQPTQDKFRRLKASNSRVQKEILAFPEAVELLRLAGFVRDGEDLVLPPTAPLQALRELLERMP